MPGGTCVAAAIVVLVSASTHATTARSGADVCWHARSASDVLAILGVTADGLTSEAAAERLRIVGPNAVPTATSPSAWSILVAQVRSVVVLLLVVACGVAIATNDVADAVAVAAVLVLNVALGFAIEMRANRAVASLASLQPIRATVLRDGSARQIDARELVPGDVIVIEAGESVPADGRLVEATELLATESLLAGESVPVAKSIGALADAGASLPERRSMVYAGTTIASGYGRAVVVATGESTELGRIGRLVSTTTSEKTLLERRLDVLGRQLVWVALVIGIATACLNWFHGASPHDLLEAAIALAVAAVPEGLPAVATITLALGVRRMARQHAIVRRLPSVETLGAVTVLCTDKTGTLTAGAMTVTRIETARATYVVSGEGYDPVGLMTRVSEHCGPSDQVDGAGVDASSDADLFEALRIARWTSRGNAFKRDDVWLSQGDPTEVALVVAARKAGIAPCADNGDAISELPFASVRQLMAIFRRGSSGGAHVAALVKGAPERVLALCESELVDGVVRPLEEVTRQRWLDRNRRMSDDGLRVVAVARGDVAAAEEAALHGLTWVGLFGITDPPAIGVAAAIDAFKEAGIRTVMITGDQAGTARAVARELGLSDSTAGITGRDIDAMDDAQLDACLRAANIFTRVAPSGKLRLVAAFQRRGEVVAMIGDGVNDAAALKRADVGVTMGRRGTDVARETAAVVLQDDRFGTIGVAIREGRVIDDNIRKFIFFLFSCNLAEVFVLLIAGMSPLGLPLEPIQILWMNLVTDTIPALALALEPGEADVMRRPPRSPSDGLVSAPFFRRAAGYAALIAASVFACIAWVEWTGTPRAEALTMNFMALSLAQVFHLGNARSVRPVVAPQAIVSNPMALAAVGVVLLLQAMTVFVSPLARLVKVAPLSIDEWLVVVVVSVVPAIVGQIVKSARVRRT